MGLTKHRGQVGIRCLLVLQEPRFRADGDDYKHWRVGDGQAFALGRGGGRVKGAYIVQHGILFPAATGQRHSTSAGVWTGQWIDSVAGNKTMAEIFAHGHQHITSEGDTQ